MQGGGGGGWLDGSLLTVKGTETAIKDQDSRRQRLSYKNKMEILNKNKSDVN